MKAISLVLLPAAAMLLSCNSTSEGACAVSATVVPKVVAKELDPSCKSEGKKLVYILDLQPKEINWDYVYSHLPGYVPGSGKVLESGSYSGGIATHNVNGIDMTQEEYDAYTAEYWRKYSEELSKDRRKDLSIPCVDSDGTQSWTAWLTDEEIAELKKAYDGVLIEDYQFPGSSSGGNSGEGGDEPHHGC